MKECEIYSQADFERFTAMQHALFSKGFKPFIIIVKAIKDHVSRQQQKYIYGIVYPHLKAQLVENGYDSVKDMDEDDFDYFLRQMFYFKTIITSKGKTKLPKRLSFGLGKKEDVIGYIDNLLKFGANIGVHIPSPQDDWYERNDK